MQTADKYIIMIIINYCLLGILTSQKTTRQTVQKFYKLFKNIIGIITLRLGSEKLLKIDKVVRVQNSYELIAMADRVSIRFIIIKRQLV